MKSSIELTYNYGFPWEQKKGFLIKGVNIGVPEGKHLRDAERYTEVYSTGFVYAYEDEESIIAVTDNIRSFPLFYTFKDDVFHLSDNAYQLSNDNEIDADVKSAFLELGYVKEEKTLFKDVKVMLPNQYLCFNKLDGSLVIKEVKVEDDVALPDTFDAAGLESMLENLFRHLIRLLDGRTAVIPLSGGYDSRLLLAGLVKHGYPYIICYTYGKEYSYEVEIAKKAIQELKVIWHFIPYEKDTFNSYLDKDGLAYDYFASQGTAIAHEQDYFAVKQIHDKGVLPTDAIFLPGYCADVLAGSQISEANEHDYTSFENSHIKNRLSKFITNGVRCFEYFGYEWRLPYWDNSFIQFWGQVPLELRRNRKLYKQVLEEVYFKPFNIHFPKQLVEEKVQASTIAKLAKSVLPSSIKKMLSKSITPKSEMDVNNLEHFGEMLKKDMGATANFENENQAHAAWYLHKLQQGQESFLGGSTD